MAIWLASRQMETPAEALFCVDDVKHNMHEDLKGKITQIMDVFRGRYGRALNGETGHDLKRRLSSPLWRISTNGVI
jgi:hypothetical protein